MFFHFLICLVLLVLLFLVVTARRAIVLSSDPFLVFANNEMNNRSKVDGKKERITCKNGNSELSHLRSWITLPLIVPDFNSNSLMFSLVWQNFLMLLIN